MLRRVASVATCPARGSCRRVPESRRRAGLVPAGLRERSFAGLTGLPANLCRRLQSVLNAGAGLIYGLRRLDHVSDALLTLHRLRVPERVQFKLAVPAFRVLHGVAPV